jgi:4-carboxymuconolactone decarboxylase
VLKTENLNMHVYIIILFEKKRIRQVTESKAQEYINEMVSSRGYVLKYHSIMAQNDFETLQAANGMIRAAYLKERSLSRKTKELIFIATLVVLKAPDAQIKGHINVALDVGASPEEILEAIEITLPEAGVVAFQSGVEVWAEAVDADRLEPTIEPQ